MIIESDTDLLGRPLLQRSATFSRPGDRFTLNPSSTTKGTEHD